MFVITYLIGNDRETYIAKDANRLNQAINLCKVHGYKILYIERV